MTAMSAVVLNNNKNNDPSEAKISSKSNNPAQNAKNKRNNYKLRDASVKKRAEVETRQNQPRKRGPKPRPKSAPMSKYRRKTANLRERLRMSEINVAFEKLRDKLPNPMEQAGKAKCEKLTKINILHVTINYIRAMENLLETGDSGVASFSEMTKNPLRDESEKKAEMQKVLATLMQRADKVHHQARSSKKRKNFRDDSSDDENSENFDHFENMDEDDEDEDDEEGQEQDENVAKNEYLDPELNTSQYTPIHSDTSWTSNDSGIACDPLLSHMNSTLLQPTSNTPLLVPSSSTPNVSQSTIIAGSSPNNGKIIPGLNNNNDDIMKEFTDFVDLVDSLQGMPEIDFEDNFEMFP